jgi:Transposase DDE domain
MYVEIVPNRNSPPAILLREGWREGNKTRKRTLANLSDWPKDKIESLRRLLRDEPLVSPQDLFRTQQTLPHGHVEAILSTLRKLGLDTLVSAKRCRERDLVVAMIAERLIHPCSKLATTRDWHSTTLAEELGISDATEDDLYEAMDWLLERKPRIEKKLADRHLSDDCLVLYDVSSSYYEGRTCPLAQYGHDRDGQKGLPIIVYGVITDVAGRPIAVDVYPGNTSDQKTVVDQVEKLQQSFGLSRVVLVGDRGMLTQPQIEKIQEHSGWGWITALTSVAIRQLAEKGALQLSFLDEKNLAEVTSPDYPGERLIACYNPLLKEERAQTPGLAGSDRERIHQDSQGSDAAEKEAAERSRDCDEGGEGYGTLQGGQALRLHDGRRKFSVGSSGRVHSTGGEARRDLRPAHERIERAPLGRRYGAQLQESVRSGARLPVSERDRLAGSTDSSSR